MYKRQRGHITVLFAVHSCQSAHGALLSLQETLDSGGTICPHEGSRLPGPCHCPSLWDCPRGLLHRYWGADLKVFRVEIAGAQVACHLSSPFYLGQRGMSKMAVQVVFCPLTCSATSISEETLTLSSTLPRVPFSLHSRIHFLWGYSYQGASEAPNHLLFNNKNGTRVDWINGRPLTHSKDKRVVSTFSFSTSYSNFMYLSQFEDLVLLILN